MIRIKLICFSTILWMGFCGCSPKVIYKDVPEDYICKPKADVYKLMNDTIELKNELKRCMEEKDKGVK